MSPQLRHVTNIYGIISTFLTPIISRLNMMVNYHTLVLPGRIDVVTTTRSRYYCLWVYLHFHKPYDNKTWQDGRPAPSYSTMKVKGHYNYLT